MKKIVKAILPLLIAAPIIIAVAISCGRAPGWMGSAGDGWEPPRPVIARGGAVVNASSLGWIPTEQKDSSAFLAAGGDLLSVEFTGEGENGFIFPYLLSDGPDLLLEKDELGLRLGGDLIAVNLSEKTKAVQWIPGAGKKELAAVRMCVLEGLPSGAGQPLKAALRKLSEINPDVGWLLDNSETLHLVLDLFDPGVLILPGDVALHPDDLARVANEPRLTSLWLSMEKNKALKPPGRALTIRKLILENWDPRDNAFFNEHWKSLQTLTIRFSKIENLSDITVLRGLTELGLEYSDELSDLSALSGFSSLKALNLTGCEKATDLSPLKELKKLNFLGLPPGVTPDQLADIVRDHKELRALEFVECKEIKNMSALRGLPHLESLVLLNDHPMDYTTLGEIKSLRFLALPKKAFEDPAALEELRRSIPECLIVQAAPFCMGSGWILLLWLSAPMAWFISCRFSRSGRGTSKKNG